MFKHGTRAVQIIQIGQKRTAHVVMVRSFGNGKYLYCDSECNVNYDLDGKQLNPIKGGWSELIPLGK